MKIIWSWCNRLGPSGDGGGNQEILVQWLGKASNILIFELGCEKCYSHEDERKCISHREKRKLKKKKVCDLHENEFDVSCKEKCRSVDILKSSEPGKVG